MLAWSAALRSFYLEKHPLFISLSPPAVHHSCLRALFLISPLCSLLAFCYLLKLSVVFSLPVGQQVRDERPLCVLRVVLSLLDPPSPQHHLHCQLCPFVCSQLYLHFDLSVISGMKPVFVRLKSRQHLSSSNLHQMSKVQSAFPPIHLRLRNHSEDFCTTPGELQGQSVGSS